MTIYERTMALANASPVRTVRRVKRWEGKSRSKVSHNSAVTTPRGTLRLVDYGSKDTRWNKFIGNMPDMQDSGADGFRVALQSRRDGRIVPNNGPALVKITSRPGHYTVGNAEPFKDGTWHDSPTGLVYRKDTEAERQAKGNA